MPSREIEEFAETLVRCVRDAAIRGCDTRLRPVARGKRSLIWQDLGLTEAMQETLLADVVDEALFQLLDAIDQGQLRIKYVASNGTEVDLNSSGELGGRYLGPGGWRAQYSKERLHSF